MAISKKAPASPKKARQSYTLYQVGAATNIQEFDLFLDIPEGEPAGVRFITLRVEKETEKAYRFVTESEYGFWMPKSTLISCEEGGVAYPKIKPSFAKFFDHLPVLHKLATNVTV